MSFSWGSLRAAFGKSKASKRPRRAGASARLLRFRRQFESLETRALLTSVAGDFNGDGISDLAIGIPTQTVAGKANAGGVQILYGTPLNGVGDGLTTANKRFITRASAGVGGNPTANDQLGAALAVGDFNRDGIADLAVGSPGMKVGSSSGAGGVYVFFGSRSGLKSTGAQLWTENSPGINGVAESGAHFGAALAAADFNRDGRIDLAIGAPNDTAGVFANAGAIHIIYGGSGGLRGVGDQLWSQADLGANGAVATGNLFGSALAAGDFNADGYRDLAIGSPGQTVNGNAGAGVVNIMYGSSSGLRTNNNQVWKASDLQGIVNANAQFGFSLATGDVNDDSRSDLAIGAPGENIPAVGSAAAASDVGAVHVLLGSSNRLTATGNQIFHENRTGITSTTAADNRFGEAIAFGRLNFDRFDDLAIGIPGENISSIDSGGAVRILYSTGTALGTTGAQLINQNTSGMIGNGAAGNEQFGSSIAIGDFDGDGQPDIATEVPGEVDVGAAKGSAHILFSNGNGVGTAGNQLWLAASRKLQEETIVETVAERNARLGAAFLARNLNEPGVLELSSGGVQIKILESGSGSGDLGTLNSDYTVKYTGTRIDGTIFDTSANQPNGTATFKPSGVIEGFREALLLMQAGDRWQIFIPSNLAYGAAGQGNIGPNETLIFDLEVVSIAN